MPPIRRSTPASARRLEGTRFLSTIQTQPDRDPENPAQTPRGRRVRRIARYGLAALLLCSIVPIGMLCRPWFDGNLGVVDPGRVIRSAQPTAGLDKLIKEHHLASILNLRGGSQHDGWYTAEVGTAQSEGVAFYDLPLKATRRPTRRELLLLIDVLDRCPYPLLIHCRAGADRTGLASAIYLMMHRDQPPQEAEAAFSFWHGHIPIFGTWRLHEPLDEYARWLESHKLDHTPARFRDWVKNEYNSDDPKVDPPPIAPGPRSHRG